MNKAEEKINISLAICFMVFAAGLLSVGADLLSVILITVLLAPLLVAFFAGPAVLLALLAGCFIRAQQQTVEPTSWEDRMD
jgi:predicted branched-subunit amino acid permease